MVQSLRFKVAKWSAWSSCMPSVEEWVGWSEGSPLSDPFEGPTSEDMYKGPSVSFLPLTFRKKLSPVSKVLLYLCNRSCENYPDEKMEIVFASRYGEANSTVELLESLAKNEPSSPMAFSRSVHNFSIGLNSIATQNCSANTAIAAMEDTFYAGLSESLVKLYSAEADRILYVFAEDINNPVFSNFYEIPCPFGVAFVLEKTLEGSFLPDFNRILASRGEKHDVEIPDSLLFLQNVITSGKKVDA